MQPSSNSDQRGGVQVPDRSGHTSPPPTSRDAAANLMRQQIDKIYDDPQPNEHIATAATTPPAEPTAQPIQQVNPYEQSHSELTDVRTQEQNNASQAHWQKYHSAWQQYYQMYYERYYQAQVVKQIASKSASNEPAPASTQPLETEKTLTKDQAVHELRSELMEKIQNNATKVRHSRHFMPALVALVVALGFLFLQYNPIIIATVQSFMAPGSTEAPNAVIDTSTDVVVGPEPKILIPKISVEAPVVYDVPSIEESVVQSKLKDGVVHYPIPGANALPGQVGNTVILGHSANDVFDDGNYKFIFLPLDKLEKGDTFYLNYGGKRYSYVVIEKKVIEPSQVSELVINNGKPLATLVTCTPAGTALRRLVVIGEQIAPDPATATAQTEEQKNATTSASTEIGGATQSFFERLFNPEN